MNLPCESVESPLMPTTLAELFDRRDIVAEAARLDGASGRHVLGIEIEHEVVRADEIFQRDGFCVGIEQREGGRLLSFERGAGAFRRRGCGLLRNFGARFFGCRHWIDLVALDVCRNLEISRIHETLILQGFRDP